MALSKEILNDCKIAILNVLENRQKFSDEVKVDFHINNQSIEIFERHPDKSLAKGYFDYSVAKITYVNTIQQWRVYWMKGNLNWTSYRRAPQADTIGDALSIVDKDEDRLFWGTVVKSVT